MLKKRTCTYRKKQTNDVHDIHFLRSLFGENPDAVYSLDTTGRFTRVNAACEQFSGYTKQELLTMSFADIMPESERQTKLEPFMSFLSQDKPKQLEVIILTKDGHRRELSISTFPIISNGKIVGHSGVAKDFSRQKKVERELRETKEKLESFINHTCDAIYIASLTGDSLIINQAFETLFQYTVDEYLQDQSIIYHDSNLQIESQRLYQKVIDTGRPVEFETLRKRKDGQLLHVGITYSPIHDANDTVIGIAGTLRDITERKHYEEALRESEGKYRILAENTLDLISILDRDNMLLYASPSHAVALGYKPEELEGSLAIERIHPEDIDKVFNKLCEMERDKTPITLEVRYCHFQGHYLLLEAHGIPLLDKSNTMEGYIIIARDITQRRHTEELLREAEKLSVLGELAAGIAHEIRNPLTSIKGFIQLLQGKVKDDQHYFEILLDELERINFIVSELLLLAKPQVTTFKEHNITEVIEHVLTLLDTQAILNNVQILTTFEPDIPTITCEDNHLKQVFINLLKNGIEATPNGGWITIDLKRHEERHISVTFTDNGTGIPKELIPKLGEPFYTTKEKGTGLGLMVSNKIIRDHHGSIQITSEQNKGTSVTVILPMTHQ